MTNLPGVDTWAPSREFDGETLMASVHTPFGGHGTIEMSKMERPTWEELLNGPQNTLIIACADKIMKWNLVWVQGAFLSLFIEPVYLDGIVDSRFFRPRHLKHNLFDWMDERSIAPRLKTLAPQFKVQSPRFGYYEEFSRDHSYLDLW